MTALERTYGACKEEEPEVRRAQALQRCQVGLWLRGLALQNASAFQVPTLTWCPVL